MSATTSRQTYEETTRGAWAVGISVFAGTGLFIIGLFQLAEGFSAVVRDKVFVNAPNYIYALDVTAWGWIHVVIGVLALITGGALLFGKTWAMGVGIAIAACSMVSSFLFIPYQPIWSLTIIAIDVAIIWSLGDQLSRR
jgi:hypothetical protein